MPAAAPNPGRPIPPGVAAAAVCYPVEVRAGYMPTVDRHGIVRPNVPAGLPAIVFRDTTRESRPTVQHVTAADARRLAVALLEAADYVDGWKPITYAMTGSTTGTFPDGHPDKEH